MRLYVVDDAAVMRAAIGHVASSLGHAVVGEAASLEDALVGLGAIAVDAVLVDGRLPAGGREAIRSTEGEDPSLISAVQVLRRAAPGAGIVVIAALDETTLVARACAAGAAGALLRPVSRSGLAAALAAVRGDSADANT
jgi:DNA-binding NarL/FixJ family response regulator